MNVDRAGVNGSTEVEPYSCFERGSSRPLRAG
jgi:hypothetical protein